MNAGGLGNQVSTKRTIRALLYTATKARAAEQLHARCQAATLVQPWQDAQDKQKKTQRERARTAAVSDLQE